MIRKRPHTPPQPLSSVIRYCFCSVSDVKFFSRKLIIFMLVQLLLSPFILITADSIPESLYNGHDQPPQFSSTVVNTSIVNDILTNTVNVHAGISAQSIENETESHESNGKFNDGNSILIQSEKIEMSAREQRPSDDNLSLIGNATILDQSRPINIGCKSDDGECEKRDETFHNNVHDERRLSRKRRYLIFPPGSSMQIVYDTYQPILGYSNYLVLGITAAMAWELPSKPIYLEEEIRESYEMGNLPLINRNDKNVSQSQYIQDNQNRVDTNYYYTNIPNKFSYGNSYKQNPYPSKSNYNKNYYKPDTSNRVDTSNKIQNYVLYADKLMKQFKDLTDKIPQNRPLNPQDFQEFANVLAKNVKANSAPKDRIDPGRKKFRNFIHPAFKKRSIDEKLTPLEKFDLNLHRQSRHALYRQLETFLQTQGSNGNECIQKMLCETSQRNQDEKPHSMVMELLRAVFTLPKPVDTVEHPIHRQYDRAYGSIKNCQELYPQCAGSVWNSKYM